MLLPVGVGDHDVGRLHVAVHQPALVRGVEGVRDLGHEACRAPRRQAAGARDEEAEALALDEAHRDEQVARVLPRAVDRDDVRVLERRRRGRLADEELTEPRLPGELGQDDLEGHRPLETGLGGAIDDAHAAGAGDRLDAVAGDGVAHRHRDAVHPARRGAARDDGRSVLSDGQVVASVSPYGAMVGRL